MCQCVPRLQKCVCVYICTECRRSYNLLQKSAENAPLFFADLLTYDGGLKVDKHCSGHMLASASLAEERVEGIVSSADGLVRGHLAVGLNAVLQTVELPACVPDLHASLSHMDRDALTL